MGDQFVGTSPTRPNSAQLHQQSALTSAQGAASLQVPPRHLERVDLGTEAGTAGLGFCLLAEQR